jgi:hypothetical protein
VVLKSPILADVAFTFKAFAFLTLESARCINVSQVRLAGKSRIGEARNTPIDFGTHHNENSASHFSPRGLSATSEYASMYPRNSLAYLSVDLNSLDG